MFGLDIPGTKARRRGLTIDTLRYYKQMRASGFTEEQAEGLLVCFVWQGCGPECRYPECEGRLRNCSGAEA